VGGKGLLSICSNNSLGKLITTKQDKDKRFLLLVFEKNTEVFVVANIYGPATGTKANNLFFEELTDTYMNLVNNIRKELPNKEIWEVVAGDKHNKLKEWKGFIKFKEAAKLRDVWREQNPTEKKYTWIKHPADTIYQMVRLNKLKY